MHCKIRCGAGRIVVIVTLAAMVLVPSARPDDGPKKVESTCVNHERDGTDESPVRCQDNGNNGTAQVSNEKQKRKERNFFARGSTWETRCKRRNRTGSLLWRPHQDA